MQSNLKSSILQFPSLNLANAYLHMNTTNKAILPMAMHPSYMGYSQNYGPLLVLEYITAPDISGYQSGFPNLGNSPYVAQPNPLGPKPPCKPQNLETQTLNPKPYPTLHTVHLPGQKKKPHAIIRQVPMYVRITYSPP